MPYVSWGLPIQRPQTAGDFFGVGAAVKGGDAEKPLAVFPETTAGRDDDVRLVQNFVESLPTPEALGRPDPEIGRVDAAENIQAGGARCGAQHFGVAQIMFDQ